MIIGDLLPKLISLRDHSVQSSLIRLQKAKQDSYIFTKLLVLVLLVVLPSQVDLWSTQRLITRLIMVSIRILVSGPLASRSAVRLRIQSEPSVMLVSEHYSLRQYSRVESITWDPPVDTVLYDFSGNALERLSAQTPERTVNVVISGVGTDEKFTVREVGVASTITLTGTLVEKQTDDYVGSGIATISGDAETRQIGVFGYYGDDADPGTSGIITVFGELNHPDIDYTPHYGIDKNIGIGTTGIQFGIGPFGFDIEGNPLGGRYYSPIYPGSNAGGVEGPGSPGIGTFRLNDDKGLTITRALLPYFGRGTINVTGIASEAFGNQVDDDVTTALFNISGVGSCREILFRYMVIMVMMRDPGTSGIITISTQTTEMVERSCV